MATDRKVAVTGPNVTSVGNATDSSLGPIVPGHKGPFRLQLGMEGTMDAATRKPAPKRVRGKLTIRG